MLTALTERDQALHHCVEVVIRQVVEEHTHFRWLLVEPNAMIINGLDGG
jgi:hypothetical protein